MRKFNILFFSFLFIQCAVDRTISPLTKTEINTLEAFQKLDSVNKIFITTDDEPGEKLVLCITYIDKASKKVLQNQPVSFYHTSTEGKYQPSNPNDETTARLNGSATTDNFGNVYIETILPGDYGNTENNRHIHTTAHGAKPEGYDIFFEQYSGGFSNFMNSSNDQMFYANLKKATDNTLICFLTIEVKNPKTTQ